jgi:hypothetical protein
MNERESKKGDRGRFPQHAAESKCKRKVILLNK